MASKVAKMIAKQTVTATGQHGGQNKLLDVPRYENGRIDYGAVKRATQNRATVVAARMRHYKKHGVTAANASSDAAGTVFGRMFLQGEITEEQYEAGREFEKRRRAYLCAIAAPPRPRSGSDLNYVRKPDPDDPTVGENVIQVTRPLNDFDGTDDEYVDYCVQARRRFADVRREALTADPLAIMALEAIVCDDKHMDVGVGALRLGCNAIARMLKIERRT